MLISNGFTCRADQNKQRVKSHIKEFRNSAFGLHTVQSHTHTQLYIYIYIYIYIIVFTAPLYHNKLKIRQAAFN